jgi:ribokinase
MRVFVIGSYQNATFVHVERLPKKGESLAATALQQEHGGKGLNLGLGLHRLGVATDLLMAIGSDSAGADVLARVGAEGLDTRWILPLAPQSGFGIGFLAPDGSNFLVMYPGANALLSGAQVEAACADLEQADWVVAQFEVPDEPIRRAFELARARGIRTFLNPSPWRLPDPSILALTDLLVVNATEAAALFGRSAAEIWSREDWGGHLPDLARHAGWVGDILVVTLAEHGCVALDESGRVIAQPAFEIEQCDATGAGDAFGCGLLWALMQDRPLPDALRIGNACGAILAASSGIVDALPTPERVSRFLSDV